jgi:hypothetical protein
VLDQVPNLGQRVRRHLGHEHLLAVAVRRLVEQLDAGEALQQRQGGHWDCTAAGHPVGLVQQPRRFLTDATTAFRRISRPAGAPGPVATDTVLSHAAKGLVERPVGIRICPPLRCYRLGAVVLTAHG